MVLPFLCTHVLLAESTSGRCEEMFRSDDANPAPLAVQWEHDPQGCIS